MKKYIKSNREKFAPTDDMEVDHIVYSVKKKNSNTFGLDFTDNGRGYTFRRFGGAVFDTLDDAKGACRKYMVTHNIDDDFLRPYFDFYKITYYKDSDYYTEEQI